MHHKVRARKFFRKFLRTMIPLLLLAVLAWGGYFLLQRYGFPFFRQDTVSTVLTETTIPTETTVATEAAIDTQPTQSIQPTQPPQEVWFQGQSYPLDTEILDLSGISFSDTSEIHSFLSSLPHLTQVLMLDCGIPDEEMDALNRKYENIQIIWAVDLGPDLRVRTDVTALIPSQSDAWLSDEDAYNLRYCTELVALDLGHMDITNIDFVAFMPKLKYLIVADSQVASLEPLRGLDHLIYLEAFLTHVTDYSPLLDCPALEDLNISWTYGDPAPLYQMTQLKRLWWGGTSHSYRVVSALAEQLPNTQLSLYDGNSTGSGWRKHPHYYEMRDLLGMYYME